MAEKGKNKAKRIHRKAGDDDKHVKTGIVSTKVADPHEHIYISAVRAGIDKPPDIHLLMPWAREVLERAGENARKERQDQIRAARNARRAATEAIAA